MGVVFTRFDDADRILAIAKNSERNLVADDADEDGQPTGDMRTPAESEPGSVDETIEADPTEDVDD
jgi:DNA gyrase subunit A